MQLPVIQGLWTVDNARVMDKTTRRQGDSIPAYDHPPRQYMGLWRRVDLPRQAMQKGVMERQDAGPWRKRMLNPVISRTPRAYHAPRVLVLDRPTGALGPYRKSTLCNRLTFLSEQQKPHTDLHSYCGEIRDMAQPTRDILLGRKRREWCSDPAILLKQSLALTVTVSPGKPGHTLAPGTVSFQWR